MAPDLPQGRLRSLLAFAAALCLVFGVAVAQASGAAKAPEGPRLFVDTRYVPPSGRTIAVRAGGDFQAALNAARPGDVISLQAGATFTGPFVLPKKSGTGWIIVRTSAPDRDLPPPGTRVTPAYAGVMPKIEASSRSAILAAAGANHYRFIGVEIRPRKGVFLYNLVDLGSSVRSANALPHHIIFDRCYLHGDPAAGTRRGIAMNSRYTAVIDSYLSDFKEVGADSQAIAGWDGPGPFKIENDYLEGAGENVIFGGADPSIPDLVPSDIEIRGNFFSKPLAWKAGEPSYRGTHWSIKNLLELKNARRVLIDGNLFEHNWPQAQNGFSILFTVRNQNGSAPWSVVEDVAFTDNIIRDVASGVNILGHDDDHPSRQTRRILIRNNLFEDVGGTRWGGGGRLFQLLRGTADVVIEHNTGLQTGNIISADGPPHTGFVFEGNIVLHNEYGIIGTGTGIGNSTLTRYFPGALVRGNVIVGGNPRAYPPGNFFPRSLRAVGFVDPAHGNYGLKASSPFKGRAPSGKDPGVDFRALSAARRAAAPISSLSESVPLPVGKK